jgi:hypothetical protein
MTTNRNRGLFRALVVAGTLALASAAQAGPPLICFPYQTGGAQSLPWGGKDAFDTAKSYSKSGLVKDTLSLLKTERSTLARMETIRRAAIYSRKDKETATELLGKLGWIALDMEAAGKGSPEAWFNAGFLAACYEQLGTDIDWNPGVAEGVRGYAWLAKAISLEPQNAEMQFAAALATHGRGKVFDEHLRKALVGAEPGSNLARSIESNLAFGDKKSIEELRRSYGVVDASGGR